VDAAARVRDLNFKYLAEGEGATVTARFGKDGITSATRIARAKARTRCSSASTTRPSDPPSVAISSIEN